MLNILISYTVVGIFIHILTVIVVWIYRKRLAEDEGFREWQESFKENEKPLEDTWRDVNTAMLTSPVMILLSTLAWPVTFIAAMMLALSLSLKQGKHF